MMPGSTENCLDSEDDADDDGSVAWWDVEILLSTWTVPWERSWTWLPLPVL